MLQQQDQNKKGKAIASAILRKIHTIASIVALLQFVVSPTYATQQEESSSRKRARDENNATMDNSDESPLRTMSWFPTEVP